MTSPKVTIVTVTYNLLEAGRKDFFLKAVESVKSQSYENIEHIIIDGASTDGTIELIESTGVTYFSEPDTGIYNAFNKGIKHAKGKYIAFLNSDDFYTRTDAIAMIVSALEESQADFCCASWDVIEEDGTFDCMHKTSLKNFLLCICACHQAVFMSKKLMEELNGFDEAFSIVADFDLINRAFLTGYTPVILDSSIVAWRKGGVSSTYLELLAKENNKVIQKTLNLSEEEVQQIQTNGYIPRALLQRLLSCLSPIIDTSGIIKYNRKRYLKHVKRIFFYVKWRRDRKVIRLFGVTFYSDCSPSSEC